jgi:hypothetical protein
MKYMLLTYASKDGYDIESFPADKREWFKKMIEFMHQLDADLQASGELVASEGLAGPAETWTVRPAGDDAVTTDGPFAETKEVLAGYWVVDVPDLDRAAEIAARIVRLVQAPIEIRAIGAAPEL